MHFRGTGYHDHNLDNRWLPETVADWQWGRAHFADASAVFYRYKEIGEDRVTKFLTICDGKLRERDAEFAKTKLSRDIFGIKYPYRMKFVTDDNMSLRVKTNKIAGREFFLPAIFE